MSLQAPPQPAAPGGPGEQSRPRPRARPWVMATALLLVLALGVWGWWWSHPNELAPTGDEIGGPAEPGVPAYVGLSLMPPSGSVHLLEAEPQVVQGGDVDVQVLVCRHRDPSLGVGFVTGAEAQIEEICESLRPAAGRVDGRDQLVLQVTGAQPGRVVVDGVAVTYRTPSQRGTQLTGPLVEVTVADDAD